MDLVCESSFQVVKQFKVEGYYIICTIDIQKDLNYKQVLRAWDLLPLDEVGKLVRRLDSIFAMYTDDFIDLCKLKCFDGYAFFPIDPIIIIMIVISQKVLHTKSVNC